MRYDVHEDFKLDVGKPDPIEVKAGTIFIPAETNVPQNKVDALVKAGTIELVKPDAPAADISTDDAPATGRRKRK